MIKVVVVIERWPGNVRKKGHNAIAYFIRLYITLRPHNTHCTRIVYDNNNDTNVRVFRTTVKSRDADNAGSSSPRNYRGLLGPDNGAHINTATATPAYKVPRTLWILIDNIADSTQRFFAAAIEI